MKLQTCHFGETLWGGNVSLKLP